jgi:outer membrane protein assembly factor BamE (lipoprotein component of BamABCDE complex)
MRFFFTAAALLAAAILAACAASGVQVSEQQAQSFQVGKSTYADVVGQLGDPTSSVADSTGSRVVTYSYSAAQSRPQNFIPYIGPYISGYDTKSSAVTFTFDSRGVLKGSTSTQNQMGTGTNLAAGSLQPAGNSVQPQMPR